MMVFIQLRYFELESTAVEDDIYKASEITLYPNPTSDNLYIDCLTCIGAQYYVTDFMGKVVVQGKLTKSLEVTSMPVGMYTISIVNKDRTEQISFMKF